MSTPTNSFEPLSPFNYVHNRPIESHPAFIQKITFSGCSSAVPVPHKCNTSGLVVTLSNGSNILVDCGEATQHQLMLSASLKMTTIDIILITHLHGDHFFGIFGLLATLGTGLGRTSPITVVGPRGLKAAIDNVFNPEFDEVAEHPFSNPNDEKEQSTPADTSAELENVVPSTQPPQSPPQPAKQRENGFWLNIIELDTTAPTLVMSPFNHDTTTPNEAVYAEYNATLAIKTPEQTTEQTTEPHSTNIYTLPSALNIDILAIPIVHRVPCVGYVIYERSKQGTLDAKKALSHPGVTPKDLGKLKSGGDLVLPDGSVVYAKDCVSQPTIGKSVAVVQDTHDPTKFKTLWEQSAIHTMVHECTYDDEMFSKAIAHSHSTSTMATTFAHEVGAKNLVLTHFSSRYQNEYPIIVPRLPTAVHKSPETPESPSLDVNKDFITDITYTTEFFTPEQTLTRVEQDFDFTSIVNPETGCSIPFQQHHPLHYPNKILIATQIEPEKTAKRQNDRVTTRDILQQAAHSASLLAQRDNKPAPLNVFIAADFKTFDFVKTKGDVQLVPNMVPDINLAESLVAKNPTRV